MSHNSPKAPQPPPPPAPFPSTEKALQCKGTLFDSSSKNVIHDCLWARTHPELQKACYLGRVCEVKGPQKCQYYKIAGILQEGPTCGLAALSMLFDGKLKTEQLLLEAKEKRFSFNGEIFSATYLYDLLCDNAVKLSNETTFDDNVYLNFELYKGKLSEPIILEYLQYGACLLVPYDPDFNHSPCIKYGRKAHWALIIGYLLTEKDEFYVIARHGKAKNMAVWPLNALSDSNANLVQFAQPKGYPNCDFLLPPGGIGGENGLKERAIIIKKLNIELIHVR